MEANNGKYTQKKLVGVGTGQTKVPARLELKTPAKKILGVIPTILVGGVEKRDEECVVNGKVITRVIFIDEMNGFNSEERADEFSTAVKTPRGLNIDGVVPMAQILQTTGDKHAKADGDVINSVSCEHVVNAGVTGLEAREISFVQNVGNNTETKTQEREITTMGECICEKFDVGEVFKLEQNVEGVLGVELNAVVKSVVCKDDKIVLKGLACAGVSVVKSTADGQTIQNSAHDFEFTKTFNKKCAEVICGNILVSDVNIKIEQREKPELVLDATLCFTGYTVQNHTIKAVEDAFSCTHNVDLSHSEITHAVTTPSANTFSDIEGNVTMPAGSPYISRVLWSNVGGVGSINVKPSNDRCTIEGVLNATLVYECEEKQIHSHNVEVPFSIGAKIDGCTNEHTILASVTPIQCNIKARRGRELLVDARVGVNSCGHKHETGEVVSAVTVGAAKEPDTHSIIIHTVQSGETLWQIAKGSCLPTAEIVRQNPGVDAGINAGDKIVMYKRRVTA
jgi:LysM repeat protein